MAIAESATTKRKMAIEEYGGIRVRWGIWVLPLLVFSLAIFLSAQVVFIRNSLSPSIGRGLLGDELTLENYVSVLTDSYYRGVFLQTVQMAFFVALGAIILAYPLAYLIARSRGKLGTLILLAVIASSFTGVVVRTLGWKVALGDFGPINQTLISLNLISSPLPLLNRLAGIVIGLIHYQLPFVTLILVPVIDAINPTLEEAAAGLGANRLVIFWKVVLPLSIPGLLAGALLVFANSFAAFTTPALLGGMRVAVVSIIIQQQAMIALDYAKASTLAFILLVIVLAIVLLTTRVARRKEPG